MTIIFFGSDPWFSPPVFQALLTAGHQVSLVVTKGTEMIESIFQKKIRDRVSKNGIPGMIEAQSAADVTKEKLMYALSSQSSSFSLSHPDIIILAAFGPPFLPNEILGWPTYGCLNVHASLLPRWRGASPVFAALAAGDKKTGVTIMKMTEKVDRGPILGQEKIKINQPKTKSENLRSETVAVVRPSRVASDAASGDGEQANSSTSFEAYDTRETLTRKLGILGGKLIVETLQKLENDHIKFISQSQKSPTPYSRRLTKDDGRIDWSKPPEEVERFIRAVTPWPGAWTEYRDEGQGRKAEGKPIKILGAHLEFLPSTIYHLPSRLVPDLVQLPGKNPISWNAFLAGHPNAKLG